MNQEDTRPKNDRNNKLGYAETHEKTEQPEADRTANDSVNLLTGKSALDKVDKTQSSGDVNIENNTAESNTSQKLSSDEGATETENVSFSINFSKVKHNITRPMDSTVLSLKHHIHSIINVAPAMQKIMFKGLLKDESTLKEAGISNGVKVMVIGSKLQDVLSINVPSSDASSSKEKKEKNPDDALCKQKLHAKVIEKGVPDDVMPGYMNGHEALPATPLKGMVNKHGNKVRITFKLESDQLWLGTKERTEKISLSSIRNVVAEKIDSHPGYHLLALQLGPTEQSRYWIYWVPSQYVEAIKDVVLGKWQPF